VTTAGPTGALLRRMDRIERSRDALLDEVDALPADAQGARPLAGKWTIREIVEHLVRAERVVLDAELRPPTRPASLGRRLRRRLSYHVVLGVLRFGIDVRAPADAMLPSGGVDLPGLRRQWRENHRELRRRIAALDERGLRAPFARHPVSGVLTAAQSLELLEAHLARHRRQIRQRVKLLE